MGKEEEEEEEEKTEEEVEEEGSRKKEEEQVRNKKHKGRRQKEGRESLQLPTINVLEYFSSMVGRPRAPSNDAPTQAIWFGRAFGSPLQHIV